MGDPGTAPSFALAPALALALVLVGCTAPPAPEAPEPEPFVVENAPADLALAIVRPEPTPSARFDVEVALSERWLKPLRSLDVAAQAPDGAHVAWFVELEETEPRATTREGNVFVLKATTPDPHHPGPRGRVALDDVASDGRARALHVATPGRYTLAAGEARVVLNVWPDAPDGASQLFLVDEDGALRFEPAELDVRPQTRVLVWNQAGRAVDVAEFGFAAYVPLAGREGSLTPIDEGLYRLVALGVEGRSRGAGSGAFLVDFERPSDRLALGPYGGEFALAEAKLEPARSFAFRADHPLASLTLRYAASSLVPAPASVVVSLHNENGVLAQASSLTGDEIALGGLPAGSYSIEVGPEHGARVVWTLDIEGVYSLPLPERLASTT